MASIVASSNLQSGTLAPSITAPSGPPSPSTNTDFFVPFFPRSVGFLPTFFPPEAGLAELSIRRLPVPLDTAEFIAFGDQYLPDALHHAPCAPALEPVMHRAFRAELAWQLVPLAPAAHAENNSVEGAPPIGMFAPGGLAWPKGTQDRKDSLPQFIGNLPDGRQ